MEKEINAYALNLWKLNFYYKLFANDFLEYFVEIIL